MPTSSSRTQAQNRPMSCSSSSGFASASGSNSAMSWNCRSRFGKIGRIGASMQDDRAEGGMQVMEHREPPRMAVGDSQLDRTADELGGSRPLRLFSSSGDQRAHDVGRAVVLAIVGLVVAAGAFYLIFRAALAGVGWLHLQPDFE